MGKDLLVGGKYFIIDENSEDMKPSKLYRVVRKYNESKYKIKDLINGGTFNITNDTELSVAIICDEYIMLSPDAYVNFSIVNIGQNKQDVIVSVHRLSDIRDNISDPYCVCRQAITNAYLAMIRTQDINHDESYNVGMCMSINSLIDGIDYKVMTACESLSYSVSVISYMEDTFDDILECVKVSKFDKVLFSLFMDYVKQYQRVVDPRKDTILDGYCMDLHKLLLNNDFMYDFKRAFNIIVVQEELYEDAEKGILSPYNTKAIDKLYFGNNAIIGGEIIPFDRDIDLEEIKRNYILVSDIDEKLYIVLYESH